MNTTHIVVSGVIAYHMTFSETKDLVNQKGLWKMEHEGSAGMIKIVPRGLLPAVHWGIAEAVIKTGIGMEALGPQLILNRVVSNPTG